MHAAWREISPRADYEKTKHFPFCHFPETSRAHRQAHDGKSEERMAEFAIRLNVVMLIPVTYITRVL